MAKIFGTDGDDIRSGTSVGDTMYGGPDTNVFGDESGNDSLSGAGGDDFIHGIGGDDLLDGGANNDRLYGGLGDDVVYGGDGNDIVNGGRGANGVADFYVNDGRDYLNGGDGDDIVVGRNGDDILDGGPGNDAIYGGDQGTETLGNEFGRNDLVTYAWAPSAVFVDLALTDWQNTGGGGIDLLISIEKAVGSAFGDILKSGSSPSRNGYLEGLGGDDVLIGGSGDDVLDGGAGADTLWGEGGGADTFILLDVHPTGPGGSYVYDTVIETAGSTHRDVVQIARVEGSAVSSYVLPANIEDGKDVGTGAFDLTGNGLGNRLTGGQGVNLLTGGLGNDTIEGGLAKDVLIGGVGDDTYVLRDVNPIDPLINRFVYDAVVENPGEGFDEVIIFRAGGVSAYTLAAGVEMGDYRGSGNFNLRGNDLDNRLLGNLNVDTLEGGAGNDWLLGYSDSDILIGGAGNDHLDGGGNASGGGDTASYADATSGITVGLGIATAQDTGGAGVDTLIGIENLTGSSFGDVLSGDAAANRFDGGAGIDLVSYAGGGSGAVVYLDGSGTNDRDALGDSFAGIENLIGSALKSDRLVGDSADNVLTGLGGADRLDGGGGRDKLDGGEGDDVLLGRTGADQLTGAAGADIFAIVDKLPAAGEHDRVMDFQSGIDLLQVDASQFGGGLVAGGPVDLVMGSTPDPSGHTDGIFLYDTDDGYLRYDMDGSGASSAVLLWVLQGAPVISVTDFLIVA